jgi:hypothetical protein
LVAHEPALALVQALALAQALVLALVLMTMMPRYLIWLTIASQVPCEIPVRLLPLSRPSSSAALCPWLQPVAHPCFLRLARF